MTFPAPGSRDASPESVRARPRKWGARVLGVSFGLSALLNLLAVVLYPLLFDDVVVPPDGGTIPGRETRPEGIVVVRISESAAPPEAPERPEVIEDEPVEASDPVPESGPEEADTPDPEEEPGSMPSAAERLRAPEEGDARIWRPVDPSLAELTPEERARLRIYGRIDALSDSLAAEEERERAGREWVYTDEEGRRWGFTPGRIHLGEYSIPFSIGGPPTVEERFREMEWENLERATESARIRDDIEDRGEAIRERRDRERADSTASP